MKAGYLGDNMQIGILTFTDGTNYGQRLQNYALQELLKSYGNDVFTVKQKHHYSMKHRIKVAVNSVAYMPQTIQQNKRKNAFEQFNKQYINFYNHILPENSDEYVAEELDLFVAGSDQIWNPNSPFVNSNMFMQFAPRQKRATYAASFSVDKIPDNKKEKFIKWISEIDYVSVRELQAVRIVEELTGKKPVLCLDPTLLLDDEKWKYMARKAKSTIELPGSYMISLFLGNSYKDEEEAIAKQTGLPLVRFKNYETAAPDEFLKIIKEASLVITDSYHVTIFSMLFHRPFIIFQRKSKGASMNSRFETLDCYFHLEDRFYENVKKHKRYLEALKADDFNSSLIGLRRDSSEYLNSLLKCACNQGADAL